MRDHRDFTPRWSARASRALRRAVLIAAVAGAAAAFGIGVGSDRGSDSADVLVARCGERSACLRRIFDDAAERGDVARVLSALDERAGDCHLEAHRLAHAVYRDLGDTERTFLLGGPQCRFGYLHGAVEASGSAPPRGAPSTHGVAIPRCSRFRNSLQRAACAHGFGHALMLRTRHDIGASVDGCRDAALRGLSAPACEAGVMMQNSLRYSGAAAYTAKASRGCAQVERSRRLGERCYDNIGLVAALAADHDAARARRACTPLRKPWQREACLRGVEDEIREARS